MSNEPGRFAHISTAKPKLVKRCRSRHWDAKNRARKMGSPVDEDFYPFQLAELIEATTHCPLCGVKLTHYEPELPHSAEVDHITPMWAGGAHALSNIQIICGLCHDDKDNMEKRPKK